MSLDIYIIRELAGEYAEAARDNRNTENALLYRAVNRLEMRRPVVLIDEEPWSELEADDRLTLHCSDPTLRGAEHYMRHMLYKWNHHPGDLILPYYFPVYKQIGGSFGWPAVKESTIATDAHNNIVSHSYEDQLREAGDLEILRIPELFYREAETLALRDFYAETFGDILPVRITGHSTYICPWDNIAMYRGAENLFYDLAERPEHIHAIMERITTMYIEQYRQFEELGLFENDPYTIHCTCGLCDELKISDGEKVLRKNVWGRGMAQILASVSPSMHEEFEIEYQKRIMEPFGLVYYGCCEPLDRKINIIKQIPHLRKISITPWADINRAAEAVGGKYVLSVKPNPAAVGTGFDPAEVKRELSGIITACRRYGCNFELVLKDISTVNHNPDNLACWEEIAMGLVENA